MIASSGAAGFDSRAAPVSSSRLTHAVAASIALSLCLIVTLTVFSTKVTLAMPGVTLPDRHGNPRRKLHATGNPAGRIVLTPPAAKRAADPPAPGNVVTRESG